MRHLPFLLLLACARVPPESPRPVDTDAVGRALVASANLVPSVIDPDAGPAECVAGAAVRAVLVSAGRGIASESVPSVHVDYTACLQLLDGVPVRLERLDDWMQATTAAARIAVVAAQLGGAPDCQVARAEVVLDALIPAVHQVLDEVSSADRDGVVDVPAAGVWPVCP